MTQQLVELIAVLLVSFIKIPGSWADRPMLSLVGSIPSFARIGLVIPWLVALGLYQVPALREFEALGFVAQHPLTALALGPAMWLAALSSFKGR